MIWVAAAGPLANFVLAGFLAFLFKLFPSPFLVYATYFNLGLAVFNLIPIPPLDGSRILTGLLPTELAARYVRLERFGFLIVLGLYFTGFLSWILLPAVNFLCELLEIPRISP